MGLKSRASDSDHGRWTECGDQLGRRLGGRGAGNRLERALRSLKARNNQLLNAFDRSVKTEKGPLDLSDWQLTMEAALSEKLEKLLRR